MIERVHLLKLKPGTPWDRREIVDHALAVLPAVPGVLGVRRGGGDGSRKSWDIFLVTCDSPRSGTSRRIACIPSTGSSWTSSLPSLVG
jgi:hypothetical protein